MDVRSPDDLQSLWQHLYRKLPQPLREYRFSPKRRFRFDLAWPKNKLAVEIDGGVWSGGRHTRGAGFERDAEKLNLAISLGWKVLRFTPQQLDRDPNGVLGQIAQVLRDNSARKGRKT